MCITAQKLKAIIDISMYVTGYTKTRLMENNNFKLMLAFKCSFFSHFMYKANTIWCPGRTIVVLPGYLTLFA